MDDKRVATTKAALDHAERAADELESKVDAFDLGADRLRDEFARLADDKVESELARLRAKVGKPTTSSDKDRSEEHTSELQSLMRISYAVFCLKKKTHTTNTKKYITQHL